MKAKTQHNKNEETTGQDTFTLSIYITLKLHVPLGQSLISFRLNFKIQLSELFFFDTSQHNTYIGHTLIPHTLDHFTHRYQQYNTKCQLHQERNGHELRPYS